MGSPKKPCCLTVKYVSPAQKLRFVHAEVNLLLQYMIPKTCNCVHDLCTRQQFSGWFLSMVRLLHKNSLNHNLTLKYRTTWCTYSQGGEGEGRG